MTGVSTPLPDIIAAISALYAELPVLSCRQCGGCCVSPTCTLAEFIYLAAHLREHLSENEIRNILASPPEIHPGYAGNLRCAFIKDSRCTIHLARTGACRLFGIPALSGLGISDLVQCRNDISVTRGRGDIAFIKDWLKRLVELNGMLYDAGKPPYFLLGLNIECWFDLYFDTALTHDFLITIRATIRKYVDSDMFAADYRQRTGIRDKLDKIHAFSELIELGDAVSLRKLMLSIRDDYPLTGTYFAEEADMYLKTIDQNFKQNTTGND